MWLKRPTKKTRKGKQLRVDWKKGRSQKATTHFEQSACNCRQWKRLSGDFYGFDGSCSAVGSLKSCYLDVKMYASAWKPLKKSFDTLNIKYKLAHIFLHRTKWMQSLLEIIKRCTHHTVLHKLLDLVQFILIHKMYVIIKWINCGTLNVYIFCHNIP